MVLVRIERSYFVLGQSGRYGWLPASRFEASDLQTERTFWSTFWGRKGSFTDLCYVRTYYVRSRFRGRYTSDRDFKFPRQGRADRHAPP